MRLTWTAFLLALSSCATIHDAPPIIGAARNGDSQLIRSLIQHGADPNVTAGVNGWTALQHAIHKNQSASVETLLQSGADPNLRGTQHRMTPLMMAAGYGYADIVRILLRHGADPALKDESGRTARDYARSGMMDIDRFTYGHTQTAALQALDERRDTW